MEIKTVNSNHQPSLSTSALEVQRCFESFGKDFKKIVDETNQRLCELEMNVQNPVSEMKTKPESKQ